MARRYEIVVGVAMGSMRAVPNVKQVALTARNGRGGCQRKPATASVFNGRAALSTPSLDRKPSSTPRPAGKNRMAGNFPI